MQTFTQISCPACENNNGDWQPKRTFMVPGLVFAAVDCLVHPTGITA